jgi:FAD synthetase
MLQAARALGDRLVVVLSNDAHNHKPNAVPSSVRWQRLKALGIADAVIVGDAGSFADSLRREKPEIIALGYDQRLPDAQTQAVVRELGIKVVVLPWMPGKEEDVVLPEAS